MKGRKKGVSVVLAAGFMIIMLVGGCAKDEKMVEKEANLPDGVTVEGGKITVAYEENPTTGFEWMYSIDNENVVKLESDAYKADDSSEESAGSGGTHMFVFKTDEAGEAVITMTYVRNWEGGETDKTIDLNVTVEKDGKVSVE